MIDSVVHKLVFGEELLILSGKLRTAAHLESLIENNLLIFKLIRLLPDSMWLVIISVSS